ncbi:alpha-amylase family glycosyl hydrolase [Paenibacillus puerhi]|uniref:alpha-amylase family glycosyl hydrolase n=1 Tax=Paenibacillus puerhi TaxID=2692622 RepID=UPI0013580B4B|nr:alpha-amylase family glycosyl hydrolase [Paenibacillus puerhi]
MSASRRPAALLLAAALVLSSSSGCSDSAPSEVQDMPSTAVETYLPFASLQETKEKPPVYEQPSRVFYEIFVRSFYDSNGDGIGDLQGVAAKLDYLQELGIEGLWLTPIHPSSSYHGYDVTDYYDVSPELGTLEDFRYLSAEARKRGIQLILDLVVNHTSSSHPWFIDSSSGPDSKYRSWYNWSEDPNRNAHVLSATGSGNAWHLSGGARYVGTFWEGMPDLNFDNPAVREEMIRVGNFWLKQGADGFRLDAAKHVYEDFQSSKGSKETAASNQNWWQEFRRGLNEADPDVFLVGEVWDSEAVIAPYLNQAFQSAFNFTLNTTLRSAVHAEKAPDLGAMLSRQYEIFRKESGGRFVDASFIGNHDADRLMSVLRGSGEHARMAAALLLTLPGHPFLYYGDEIGMKGSGADENKREPMLWHAAGKGEGQTTWKPARSNSGADAPSVEAQLKDPNSLLNRYKQLIDWRKREPALRDGDIAPFAAEDPGLSAFIRRTAEREVLVVHNLTSKPLELDVRKREPERFGRILLSTEGSTRIEAGILSIPAYSSVVLQ